MSAPINNGCRAHHNVFSDLMGDNFFHQFISGPTRISRNELDLLLSNWPEVIANVSTFHPRDGRLPSDHYVTTFKFELRFKRSKGSTRQVFDFKKGNLDALGESLLRTPFQIAVSEDIDEYWSNWKDLFLSAVYDHVPTKTVRDINTPPWIDGEVRHLIRKKYATLRKYRQDKTEERKQKLRALSKNLKECLSGLDTSKACGPDGILARLLKECSEQIAPSLCMLFNFSLSRGKLPYEWETADITPLHKKYSKEPAENYRPISLLTITSKVLERCVSTRFYDHVKLINHLQHGFMKNRLCVTQLLSVLHAIGEALDKNIQLDLIYLDFAKAFDSVDHLILLAKLKAYGVSGPRFAWFTDYLAGRAQRVIVEGASKWAPVTSGVPQGSLLGPLLFTIFIDDLPDEVVGGVRAALYADDTKLYKSVSSICDCQSLKTTLGNLNNWSKRNRIKFNTSNCKSFTVTNKKSPLVHEYTLDSALNLSASPPKKIWVFTSQDRCLGSPTSTLVLRKPTSSLGF
ncbi:putative RNA-directed DNA polymerase from transposon X-element [Stylophora pistillata]|uniref:Putative RNA-directed DNA polymerase from transposon X-element n=1 Tax=Stylophora pistillata TaxID=50429 RepID=A0A2B4S3S5_STYPI|nr:putative RNA-directed DNA polymerase from transposon X-element [Stylophora pistillata]